MKILLLGDAEHAVGTIFPEDAQYSQDLKDGPFNIIYADMVLQHMFQDEAVDTMKLWRDHLVSNGELWVTVPSLEWAARELVFEDQPSQASLISIYGTRDKPNKVGFVLVWLRAAMENAGFITKKALQEKYIVSINGKDYPNVLNLAIGMRYDAPASDPAAAID